MPEFLVWGAATRWALAQVKLRPYRVLGRFRTWRRAVRAIKRHRVSNPPKWARSETLFKSLSPLEVTNNLRDVGYHSDGLLLPPTLVEELRRHAETSPARAPNDPATFIIHQVTEGRSPNGNPVAVADVDPNSCAAVQKLAGDAKLLEIVKNFLGYMPTKATTRIWWSPPSALSMHDRRCNGQTVDFHYDIEPTNALYLFFYLSDTNATRGAHVVVRNSHNSKPLFMQLRSTRQPEQVVITHYGAESIVVLEGGAGYGFFEDPAIFHKALPPSTAHRLILQYRYS